MTKRSLTVGKYRALQRSSTPDGLFTILALDHQDALRRAIRPDDPAGLTADEMIRFKRETVSALVTDLSGVLLDPVYGAPQGIAGDILARAGLLVELERAGYRMAPLPLDVEIEADWCVAKIKRMGADGAKLFYYYNPANAQHAARQDAVVRRVVSDCRAVDLPLYAEPIFYPAAGGPTKRAAVIESARRAAQAGTDVLKLEFPVDDADEATGLEACAELTAAVGVPWVLLSAGVSFEVFLWQLELACKSGASGFIVGRALWDDAARIADGAARRDWLEHEGRRRVQLLASIVERYARSWRACYAAPVITTEWFRHYDG